ncbi:MAG: potassium channel family protein [Desulfobacteraceae bacterium]|nr:potassium channel family protein [Desulfobacteraceae bacterium]
MQPESSLAIVAIACGIALIVVVLWEAFETIILPRRVARRFRLTRLFYRATWFPWVRVVARFVPARRQETWLSFFGPLSPILLLSLWAGMLITGFGLLYWALGATILTRGGPVGFLAGLYLSGTTFFTLGIGDAVPGNGVARFLVVVEAGTGFAFLALVIGYLPALNQSLTRREISISLLDARAGSPPTASEMLRRHGHAQGMEALRELLFNWELWSAELLEGHLSYSVLTYFRSQHDNQSWLAALTAVLDTCAMVMAGLEGPCRQQAELTFAIARHALVDLCIVFRFGPREAPDRLPPEKMAQPQAILAAAGIPLQEEGLDPRLRELRRMYEPYVNALAFYLRFTIPPWVAGKEPRDNWQTSIWEPRAIRRRPAGKDGNEHF